MLNAYILFQKTNPASKLRFVNFQVNVIKSIITPYNRALTLAAATDECVTRLTGHHVLEHTLSTAKGAVSPDNVTFVIRNVFGKK